MTHRWLATVLVARIFRALLPWSVIALLFGCATYQGIEEFTLYQTAFDKAFSTSTSILDQLAVQERAIFARLHPVARETDVTSFDPKYAAYYTDTVDPPGTAAFRHALQTVKTYNDLLYGLASGQTAQSLVAKIGELQGNIGKASTDSANLLKFAAGAGSPELTTLAAGLDAAFTRLQPFVTAALSYRTRDQFRIYLGQNYETVRSLLVTVRDGTTVIFPVLTAETLRRARVDPKSGALTQDEIAKIKTYRALLSDWVIMLNVTIQALDKADAAVTAAPTLSGSVAGLNQIAVDLDVASAAARKHLAELSAK